jgi:hypothetical protein
MFANVWQDFERVTIKYELLSFNMMELYDLPTVSGGEYEMLPLGVFT